LLGGLNIFLSVSTSQVLTAEGFGNSLNVAEHSGEERTPHMF
jgi:hypothetical protein